ncbi:MAG: toxin HicA [Peptococcaceae bacterium]|nr:toxin HicA [Peptococcaceae bacterium]
MSKLDKLIKEIFSLDKNLRFDELAKILDSMGYTATAPRGGSSHVTFRKAGKMPITIPQSYPINKTYVEMVKNAIVDFESEVNG